MARLEYFLMKQVTVITLLMFVHQLNRIVDFRSVAFWFELVASGIVFALLQPSYLFYVRWHLDAAQGTHCTPVA